MPPLYTLFSCDQVTGAALHLGTHGILHFGGARQRNIQKDTQWQNPNMNRELDSHCLFTIPPGWKEGNRLGCLITGKATEKEKQTDFHFGGTLAGVARSSW
jgi:hypothetical protein